MSTEIYYPLIFLITAVACLRDLLFRYDPVVIYEAGGSLEKQSIVAVEANPAMANAAISENIYIITSCGISVGLLLCSFILKYFKPWSVYSNVLVFFIAGGFAIYSQFLSLPDIVTESLKNFIQDFIMSSALVGCLIGALMGDKLTNSVGLRNGFLIAAALFLISARGSAYPETFYHFGRNIITGFIIYNFVGGIGGGLAIVLASLYIVELGSGKQELFEPIITNTY